ncbi:MAG: TIGR00266 family protein [Candidatus Sericytochromatia bacterium]|nr:TIGR00266 family protein [Candidatus Tanganyikabacteria bacterium]
MPQMHEVDFEIKGETVHYVEVELDPGEAAVSEAGAMLWAEDGIVMETLFGDGSQKSGGFLGSLLGAGKRLLTGESLFVTIFHNQGTGKRRVAFSAHQPGEIVPVSLDTVGGTLIAQKEAFLCGAKGVSIGLHLQRKLGAGFFGGEGFIMQKLEGDGLVFLSAGGSLIQRSLRDGERLRVDTGCVVAYETSVDFDIELVRGLKSMFFSGEGMFQSTLVGPGRIWLQSMPFSRMASAVVSAAGIRPGSSSSGGGSALGMIGDMLGGNE